MSRPGLGALALLAAALLSAGCHRTRETLADQPSQRLEEVRLTQSSHGKPAWDLLASRASLENADATAVLTAPEVVFYKDRKAVSKVSAEMGVVQTVTHDVTLSSSVVVRGLDEGTTLSTEELVYSSKKKKFVTDRDVLVKRPGGTLRGKGLEASPDLSDIRIFNQRTVIEERP